MEEELKILCPYCSAPYTADMNMKMETISSCDTCGTEVESVVDVICENCKKVVYRKEISEYVY